jgi:hypothetical protein
VRSVCAALLVLAASASAPARAAAPAPRPDATTPAPAPAKTTPADDATTPARTKGAWRSPPVPPRIDGAYLGMAIYGTASLARVNKLDAEGSPFAGFGGHARVGQMVLPWLGFGLSVGGALGVRSEKSMGGVRQRLGIGELMVDTTFVPIPKLPWSLRAGFGFGGGAVRQAGVDARAGFGGAMFSLATRYEWFPFAKRFRPNRGGGFGVGPELGWLGATPSAKGRPMAHVMYLGLSTTIYFGT